jgi:hypothetical protein
MEARIENWNWRYEIGCSDELSSEVYSTIKSISPPGVKKIYLDLFEKFESFVSLETLVRLIKNNQIKAKDIEELIKKKGIYNINLSYIEKVSRRLAIIGSDSSKVLQTLLSDQSINVGPFDRKEYFEIVFKKDFITAIEGMKENILIGSKPEKMFTEKESEKVFSEMVHKYRKIVKQHGFDFKVNFDHAPGFAEYWPVILTGSPENSLIIHQNLDNRCHYNLDLTFAHEIFPGHGYFYDVRQKQKPSFIDEGAFFLVEGWATLAEWMENENPRANYNKKAGLNYLQKMLTTDYEAPEKLLLYYKERGFSDEYIDVLEENFLQLPGFLESYYLGALWLEMAGGIKDHISFSKFMQKRPWGDCFRLW